jgi:hypothetical protein
MAQIFPKATNPLAKASLFGGVFILAAVVYVFDLLYKGPYVNEASVIREQLVPFSHQHHVKGLGIDCRYCHTSVETSSFAGIPSVKTCMTCHSQIWTNAELLEPVREAWRTGRPLPWARVNSLPQFVYFDHSIHVHKGVACEVCHGPVGDMPLSWRQNTLQMKWCLSCHSNPEAFVRPREAVFALDWKLPKDHPPMSKELMTAYHVKKQTDCYTCHR